MRQALKQLVRSCIMVGILAGFVGSLLLPATHTSAATTVTVDPAFNGGSGFNGTVEDAVRQSDGSIIAVGSFTSYNGVAVPGIARLQASGALDSAFNVNVGTGANGAYTTVALQSDGKIIVGGLFSSFNGTSAGNIVRLTVTGSLDGGFGIGTGTNGQVMDIAVHSDDKIAIGGQFTTVNSITRQRIAQLTSTGAVDGTFNSSNGASGDVYSVVYQPDGKLLLAGTFGVYNSASRVHVARANTNGTVDTSFTPGTGATGVFLKIPGVQADGKIYLSGNLITSYDGTAVDCLFRINSDGTLDNTFNNQNGMGTYVNSIYEQTDGKLVLAGNFGHWSGQANNPHIARITAAGALDATFDAGTGFNAAVTNLLPIDDDNFFVLGYFTSYDGVAVGGITQLQLTKQIAGTVYTDEGATPIAAGKAVRLYVNGVNSGLSDTTDAGGAYAIEGAAVDALNGGEVLTLFIDNQTEKGITVTKATGDTMTGIDIYQNYLIPRSDNGSPLTAANLIQGTRAIGDSDVTTRLIFFGSSPVTRIILLMNELYIPAGHSFDVSSLNEFEIISSGGAGHIDINGTLTAGSTNLELNGNWDLDSGGTYSASGNSITFTGSQTQYLIHAPAMPSHIIVNAAGTNKVMLQNNLNLGSLNLTVQSGYLDLNGHNLTMNGGTFSNMPGLTADGGIQLQGSETVTFSGGTTQDSDSGVWLYYGDGTGAATTHTIKDFGANDYYQLFINDTSGSNRDTFLASSGLSVGRNLMIDSGTVDMNGQSLSVGRDLWLGVQSANGVFLGGSAPITAANQILIVDGTFTATNGQMHAVNGFSQFGGTFNHAGGDILISGGPSAPLRASDPLNDVRIDGASAESYQVGDLELEGSFVIANGSFTASTGALVIGEDLINSGAFTAPSVTMSIAGDFINQGTFAHNGGTVTFNGGIQSIFGSTDFNTVTKTQQLPGSNGLYIEEDAVIGISGTLTMHGSSGARTQVRTVNNSGSVLNDGSTSVISFNGFGGLGQFAGSWLDVRDSIALDINGAVSLPLNPANSLNAGRNGGWFGLSISGLADGAEPGTPATFTVTAAAANATGSPVQITYGFSGGTATSGTDYDATVSPVSLANNATTTTISVPVVDDTMHDPSETIGMALVSASAGSGYDIVSTAATRTITDDDDDDGDGVADALEDLAPGGDGNGDGIADKTQATVATNANPATGQYTTLAITNSCTLVDGYHVTVEGDLGATDTGYDYPLGLNDFSIQCGTPGESVTATFYYDQTYDDASYSYRKFYTGDGTFGDISSQVTIDTATVNGTPVTTTSYSLVDGGPLDDDGTANAAIIDPAGLAVRRSVMQTIVSSAAGAGSAALAATGRHTIAVAATAIGIAGVAVWAYRLRRPAKA